MPVDISNPAIVLRLPHFRLVGNEVFFLVSRRPYAQLSTVEIALWQVLDNGSSVAELRKRFPEDADRSLQRFTQLGICTIGEASYPAGRKRVLVFEPHSDDAVLSVGATMWLRRHEFEFIVVTVGSRSNYTSYFDLDREFFDVEKISSLRSSEGTLLSRLIGGQYRALNQSDAPLRYRVGDWSLDWYRRHKISVLAFITHHSDATELGQWMGAIRAVLSEDHADEVWFPLGGPHTDHQLTRDAFLTLMVEEGELFRGRKIRLYQDVPYAVRFPEFTSTVVGALTQGGAILAPEIVTVSSVFDDKRRLVSLYASQFKVDAIWSDVEACGRLANDGGGLAEQFWHLTRPPKLADPELFRADAPLVQRAANQLAQWASRHHEAELLRLLMLVPAGRWTEDMEYLLQFFPRAEIDAYVASAALAEVSELNNSRIRLRPVGAGRKAWALLAFRLIVKPSAPTIFLAGEARLRQARLLSLLWPRTDTAILPTLDQLVAALRALASKSPASHLEQPLSD
jgi:LmbE family N-acetylglucosaminyl deacetylase